MSGTDAPARLSSGGRSRRRGFPFLAALAIAALWAPPPAAADMVVIHNRGEKIKLEGAQAQELIRLCADIVRRAESQGMSIQTEYWRYLRAHEVVVEVHFDEPQSLEVRQPNERDHAQHIFVPLTGELAAGNGDGDYAQALTGRTGSRSEVPYIGIEYLNAPDEYHVQYTRMYHGGRGLAALRQAVAQLGIEAPAPTAKPTEVLDTSPIPYVPFTPTAPPVPR